MTVIICITLSQTGETFEPFTFLNQLQYFRKVFIIIASPHILRLDILHPINLKLFILVHWLFQATVFTIKSKFTNTHQENYYFIFLTFVYKIRSNRGNQSYFFIGPQHFRHMTFINHDSYATSHHHRSLSGPLFPHSHLHKFTNSLIH